MKYAVRFDPWHGWRCYDPTGNRVFNATSFTSAAAAVSALYTYIFNRQRNTG